MSVIFGKCYSLLSLPDISKWNLCSIKDINCLFYGCLSLNSFPNILRWNIENIEDKSCLNYDCFSSININE